MMFVDHTKRQNLVSLYCSHEQMRQIEDYADRNLIHLQHIFRESVIESRRTGQAFSRTIVAMIEYVVEHDQCDGILLEQIGDLGFSSKQQEWFCCKIVSANKTLITLQPIPDQSNFKDIDQYNEIECEYHRFKQIYLQQIDFQLSDFPKVISLVIHSSTCFSK